MNACEEMLIACDLQEVLGGKSAPDLVERTLQRLREPKAAPAKVEAAVHALPSWPWQRFALAASVVLALGLIGWLAWPRALPEGVSAARGASYAVRADFIELREGALLLQTGAPEVRAGTARVSKVNGRSVVNAGGIPENFAALEELPLTETEKPMLKEIKRWSVAAGVALCVLSGSALLNDRLVEAKDEAPAPEKVESPKPEDIKGLQAMLEKTTSVTVRGLDASYRMCCPVEVTNAIEVKELVDAIYSDLELSDKPAGWSSSNQITFHLSDGREIEILVNMRSGLADLRLAGWERYYEYNVRADLLQRFQRPIDRSVANGPDCPAPAGLRKLRGWSGADSRIEKPEFFWINHSEAWVATWNRHRPGMPVPDVNFEKERVLAIFQGQTQNSRGIRLIEILRDELSKDDEFVIRFDDESYQTMGGTDSVTPFGIFVLTLSRSVNHLQENVQSRLDSLPLWQSREITEVASKPGVVRDYITFRAAPATTARLRGWEGEGSGVKADRNMLIESKAAFEALWKEHKPNEAAPEVDFEKEQVVAMFQEVPQGWGGVKITDLLTNSARTILHVRAATWQSNEGSEPRLTMSFGIHVFRRDLKLVLETPNFRELGEAPRWLETAWK